MAKEKELTSEELLESQSRDIELNDTTTTSESTTTSEPPAPRSTITTPTTPESTIVTSTTPRYIITTPITPISPITPVVPTTITTTTTIEPPPLIYGCTDPAATNYDYRANTDDGSCVYPPIVEEKTITFDEKSKGWTSFKSFVPEIAISCVNQYYSFLDGQIWKHNSNELRNTFYENFTESSITPILNSKPELIKHFNTLNYEGSQSKVDQLLTDEDYYNLQVKDGWYVNDVHTNKQNGTLNEFIEKEDKWFNYIKGIENHIDTAAFNFQGLGIVETINI
tara:strand:- start:1714 stop:2556 length:843 start_codon:yes stop_codon:yes gene_type:complete